MDIRKCEYCGSNTLVNKVYPGIDLSNGEQFDKGKFEWLCEECFRVKRTAANLPVPKVATSLGDKLKAALAARGSK
jgi:hypothetical protein